MDAIWISVRETIKAILRKVGGACCLAFVLLGGACLFGVLLAMVWLGQA